MQLPSNPDDLRSNDYQALAALMQATGLEATSLNLLRAAAPTPEAASTLLKWMALHPAEPEPSGPSPFQRLAAAVDESPFSLGSWLEALLAAHDWMAARQLRAGFTETLDYVACCASTAPGGQGKVPLAGLRDTVLDMLDAHGIHAASRIA